MFIEVDEHTVKNLSRFGVCRMWLEIDRNGTVLRELGFDQEGDVVHRFPGSGPYGRYGVFDLATFSLKDESTDDFSPAEFEAIWNHVELR